MDVRFRSKALLRWMACAALVTSSFGAARTARADVSSWAAVSGGTSLLEDQAGGSTHPLLQLDAGLGTTPNRTLVFGVLFRSWTHFGEGTDWSLAQRTATGGFARGGWGVALDLGVYQRFWGEDSTGGAITLTGGAPWGLQLGVAAALGTQEARMLTFTLGIDWARLTAHRSTGQKWWRNYVLPRETQANR